MQMTVVIEVIVIRVETENIPSSCFTPQMA